MISQNKLLIISGPTATGKTALALEFAKKFNGELISADSRQIYQGMDIGTGKDQPTDTKIHLIDSISPDKAFSAAEYRQLALPIIKNLWRQHKLPIIVGGTGQYIDAILNPRPTFTVKPNPILRAILNHLPLNTLQFILRHLDFPTFNSLNNSDLHNPHRLIRKIEIRLLRHFIPRGDVTASVAKQSAFDFLHFTLTAPQTYLYSRIDRRIQTRLNQGLLTEIASLLTKYSWSSPGLNTLAYKEFQPYFSAMTSPSLSKEGIGVDFAAELANCIHRWTLDEHHYAKRQLTWFKKINNTVVIDISSRDYKKMMGKIAANWYN